MFAIWLDVTCACCIAAISKIIRRVFMFMLCSGMEVVWHGEFSRLFGTFYPPHIWYLTTTNQAPNHNWKQHRDSAKVRFCCQVSLVTAFNVFGMRHRAILKVKETPTGAIPVTVEIGNFFVLSNHSVIFRSKIYPLFCYFLNH